VRVTTPAGTSAVVTSDRFTFTPSITGLTPSAGSTAGGASVLLKGSGFALGATATTFKFGTAKSSSVNCLSSTECEVVAPPHAAGTVDVTATVGKVSSPRTSADHYTYS
jgi:large repetitive protein